MQGVLLGLVEGNKLEITNCFPFSQNSEENDEEDSKSLNLQYILYYARLVKFGTMGKFASF